MKEGPAEGRCEPCLDGPSTDIAVREPAAIGLTARTEDNR